MYARGYPPPHIPPLAPLHKQRGIFLYTFISHKPLTSGKIWYNMVLTDGEQREVKPLSEVWKALGFVSLGMIISECYNIRAWRTYYKGRAGR